MLRQTVSGWVYFWVSDSVSMAADASERKALRYKQTLVSVPSLFLSFFLPVALCDLLCPSLHRLHFPAHFQRCVRSVLDYLRLHDAPVLRVQGWSPELVFVNERHILCVCVYQL